MKRMTTGIREVHEEGELKRLKAMIAAAVKVFWLKRGSRNEGLSYERRTWNHR